MTHAASVSTSQGGLSPVPLRCNNYRMPCLLDADRNSFSRVQTPIPAAGVVSYSFCSLNTAPIKSMAALPTLHAVAPPVLLDPDPTAHPRARLRPLSQVLHRRPHARLLPLLPLPLRLERRARHPFMPHHSVHEARLRRALAARHDRLLRAAQVQLSRLAPGTQTPAELGHPTDAGQEHVLVVLCEHRALHEHRHVRMRQWREALRARWVRPAAVCHGCHDGCAHARRACVHVVLACCGDAGVRERRGAEGLETCGALEDLDGHSPLRRV